VTPAWAQGLSLVGQRQVVEMGSINGPGSEPHPGAIQGVQKGEKRHRDRHRAGDKAII